MDGSGLTAFFYEDLSHRQFWIETLEVIRWWPLIYQSAARHPQGTGFVMKFKGKDFKKIYDPPGGEQWAQPP